MAWIDDVVAGLQQQGASPFSMAPASPFPDVPQEATPEQQAAAAQAARDAAGERLIRANQRRALPFGVPDQNSAGIQLAMDQAPAGTGMPLPMAAGAPDGSAFGAPVMPGMETIGSPAMPPSMQLASGMAGPVPLPQPRPADAPQPIPTDLSSITRQAAVQAAGGGGAPTTGGGGSGSAPSPAGPAAPPVAPGAPAPAPATPGFLAGMKAAAPDFTALGAAWGNGDWGPMQRQQQQEQALRLQAVQNNATARLLQSKGASPQEVAAAVAGGPATIKALLDQYLVKDKFQVVKTGETENEYGAKKSVYSVFNQADGTHKEITADSADDAKTQAASGAASSGLTGKERMDALTAENPDYAREVQAVIEGRKAFPTGKPAQTPIGRKLIQDVFAVSGDTSEADFKNRQAVRKRYTSGKDFDITKSINTVVKHGHDLVQAIDDLHNYSILPGFLNPVTGKVAEQFNPQYQAALGRFKQNADTFARDYDFAVSGGRPTVSGRQAQRELFNEYGSKEANMGSLQKSMELLNDRLQTHVRGYEEGMLPTDPKGLVPQLDPQAAEYIRTMAEAGHGGPAAGAKPAAGAALKPGKYVWDPKTGGIVPK